MATSALHPGRGRKVHHLHGHYPPTPLNSWNARASGGRVLIDAMGPTRVRRLVVITGFDAGDSRRSGGWLNAWLLLPLLRGAIYADKYQQEALVRASSMDWTILRPGFLTDGRATGTSRALIDLTGIRARRISRAEVARVMLACLAERRHLREVVLLTE